MAGRTRGPADAAAHRTPVVTRVQVLRHRVGVHGLDRSPGTVRPADVGVLDLGVQDTGPDGAPWALLVRGARAATPDRAGRDLVLVWTLRGAPHLYRRPDLLAVLEAVLPFSQADAGKRILTAATPLRDAGIAPGEALRTVAEAMRRIVTGPMVKGEVSTLLTRELPAPYLRWCDGCGVTHAYEMLFRLGALPAGLELVPGTSPPVLRPIPRWPRSAADALATLPPTAEQPTSIPRLDVVRGYLHLLGPARPADVAAHLEAPLTDVTRRWQALEAAGGLAEVEVDGRSSTVLAEDLADLLATPGGRVRASDRAVRLLGPYDPYLQGKDRSLLVQDPVHQKALWRTLGRPGAVLADGEVVGTWRPRASGRRLQLATDAWVPWDAQLDREVDVQAELLAASRDVVYAGRTA